MLTIVVPEIELFDDETDEFTTLEAVTLELEHSLVSLSKWESKFEKAFLGKSEKTPQELLGYVQAMSLDPKVPEEVFHRLSEANVLAINAYIDAKMSAVHFHDQSQQPGSRETITAELIYFWMIQLKIPIEFQHWHLNRLFTLIRVCERKQRPAGTKTMGKHQLAQRNREINEQRRRDLGTTG